MKLVDLVALLLESFCTEVLLICSFLDHVNKTHRRPQLTGSAWLWRSLR